MRKEYSGYSLSVVIVVMAVIMLAFVCASPAANLDRLHAAVRIVESNGDPDAYVESEDSGGELQIRPCVVADCNRILKREAFTLDDRFDVDKSKEMFFTYLKYWGKNYTKLTGKRPTSEVYARIWNGGPTGWKKSATRPYWQKVAAQL